MGVVVINPRDCLNSPSSSSSFPKIKVFTPPSTTTNPKPNRAAAGRNHRQRRSPPRHHGDSRLNRSKTASTVKPQLNQPVIGQIKILKRGELLTNSPATATATSPAVSVSPAPAPVTDLASSPDLRSTDRIIDSLDSEKVLLEGLAKHYAGSSMFVASPPPSSVPLPAFFKKKVVTDDATSDLRRILRLDL